MAYEDFKDLPRRTAAGKVLRDKTFKIAKDPKYDGYQRSVAVKNEILSNQELAEELHKPVIKKFEKRKLQSSFIDSIWVAYLADTQLVSKYINRFRFLLCVVDNYYKFAWVIPLKDERSITITNTFQKILNESNHKPNRIWVDKESESYNRSVVLWMQDNDIEMYWTHNKGKSVVVERFIITLKNKIYEYMTSVWKNEYINKLDDIMNK